MTSVPDFIVIGGQKCGSTTLYEDLRDHPDVVLAPKESASLLGDPGARSRAKGTLGEVSTKYTQMPRVNAAAQVAAVLPRSTKVVYMMRDPVTRTISHHRHLLAERKVDPDVNVALDQEPDLVNFSCYALQLRPWVEMLGADRVLPVRFEDYMNDRQSGVADVYAFLGLAPHALSDPTVAHNVASEKRVAVGRWRRVQGSTLYQRAVRRAVPASVRRRIYTKLLPVPPAPTAAPSRDSLQRLVGTLQPEVDALAELVGLEPWWDLAATHLAPA